MRRIGKLFEQIANHNTVVAAAWRAAIGKRSQRNVSLFLNEFETNVNRIVSELSLGNYQFSNYQAFSIRDTKSRTIHAPSFRDRVTDHAIIAVTRKAFEAGASNYSYACRIGKGQHAAIRQAQAWTHPDQWYGKMDVEKFYDSVDHRILLNLLKRRFRETKLIALFEQLLSSYQTMPGKGLPIGALTSQYLGNFYLDQFDKTLARRSKNGHLIRYMDDSLIWANSKPQITEIRKLAIEALHDLNLILKNDGEWNRTNQGIPFLGFIIYPDRLRLNKNGRQRFRKKIRTVKRAYFRGEVSELQAQQLLSSLANHTTFGDDLAWRTTVLSIHDFGDEPGPRSCVARRCLEQHADQLSVGLSQQERPRQSQQEHWFPAGCGPRIGDTDSLLSPDDVHSCASMSARAEAESIQHPAGFVTRDEEASREFPAGDCLPQNHPHKND